MHHSMMLRIGISQIKLVAFFTGDFSDYPYFFKLPQRLYCSWMTYVESILNFAG